MSKKSRRKVKRKTKTELLKERLILISVLVSGVSAFIIALYMFISNLPGPNVFPPDDERLMRGDSQIIGNRNSSVTIVEFVDLACGTCKKYDFLLKSIVEKYEGNVRLIIRHFPREENSRIAARAVESAALQGRFWEMENLLIMRQEEWASDQSKVRAYLLDRANELGLNTSKFDDDLDSPAIAEKIRRDLNDAENLGVKISPTFFVNGHRLHHVNGRHFAVLIDRQLRDAAKVQVRSPYFKH